MHVGCRAIVGCVGRAFGSFGSNMLPTALYSLAIVLGSSLVAVVVAAGRVVARPLAAAGVVGCCPGSSAVDSSCSDWAVGTLPTRFHTTDSTPLILVVLCAPKPQPVGWDGADREYRDQSDGRDQCSSRSFGC